MDIGAQLRSSREGKRLSLETVARTIRVQPRVLVAIERNDSTAIPPRPFGRGFVRAYAREVGLNPDQTVRDYFEQFAPLADAPVAEPVTRAQARDDFRLVSSRPILIGTLAIAIVLIGAGLLVRAAKQPARDASFVGTSGGPAPAVASGDAGTSRGRAACAAARRDDDTCACDHRRHRSQRPVLGDSTHRRTPRALPDAQAGREVNAQRGSRGEPARGKRGGFDVDDQRPRGGILWQSWRRANRHGHARKRVVDSLSAYRRRYMRRIVT